MRQDLPTVVLIGPTSERYKGGIAQFTRHLADQLAEVSEVHLFSWYQLYPTFLITREFRDRVSSTATGKQQARFMLGYMNPVSWLRCARAVRALKPYKIILTWNHAVHAPVYAFLNFYFKRFINAELVYVCHNVQPHESFPGATYLTSSCFRKADRIVVHGKSEANKVRKLVGTKKITSMFLPLHNFFCEENSKVVPFRKSYPKEILFFGNVRRYKGLDTLLHALPTVLAKEPDVHLRIVGEQFYSKKSRRDLMHGDAIDFVKLLGELGIEHAVTTDFRYIPNEEVPYLFREADIAVFPYRSATQSGPITVAYSYDVPVIATRVGGLPDVVLDGESGYLVEPDNPTELAEAILRFFERPIPKERVRAVASGLSWKRYVDGLLNDHSFVVEELQRAVEPLRKAE